MEEDRCLADLPSYLLQDILFRAARGATADRVAELLSVCKLFRFEIKVCSVNHATHARPDANQPLKLRDCAALESLVVEGRERSIITQHFLLSAAAVAVQALTSLTFASPPNLCDAYWLEIGNIINAAPALAVLVLKNAPAPMLTCLGSLHTLTSLRFESERNCSLELSHSIMHLTALQDLHLSCSGCLEVPDSIGQLTALQTLKLTRYGNLVRLPNSIGLLTALQTLHLT